MVTVLFTLEAPEIREGVVKIEAIAREPGVRTKIAVSSMETRVDPIGACVGVRGVRVQAVVRELGGERMDIISFTSDVAVLIARALSPARVEKVVLSEEEKKAVVIVPDDQLSLAIGKGGQNVRLASRLTGRLIDLATTSMYAEYSQVEKAAGVLVTNLPGIGAKIARQLEMGGFETVRDVAKASVSDLIVVPGIGKIRAEKLRESAVSMMRDIEQKLKAEKAREDAAVEDSRSAEQHGNAEDAGEAGGDTSSDQPQ